MTDAANTTPAGLLILRTERVYGRLSHVCLCACGSEFLIPTHHYATRKIKACRPCVAKLRAKPRLPDMCSVCSSTAHNRATCPERLSGERKFLCGECAGLPHRVLGPKCRTCGTRYAAEEPVERGEMRVGNWNWLA
jgi:hypothetical protein